MHLLLLLASQGRSAADIAAQLSLPIRVVEAVMAAPLASALRELAKPDGNAGQAEDTG